MISTGSTTSRRHGDADDARVLFGPALRRAIVWFACLLVVCIPHGAAAQDGSRASAIAIARRGLLLEIGLGLSAMAARWTERREPASDASASAFSPDVGTRLRVGYAVREGLAPFVEARADVPLFFPVALYGLIVGGAGLGITWFPHTEGVWHLDLSVRRAVARRLVVSTGVAGGPTNALDNVWLAEVALGRVRRTQSDDRGWSFSLFGGSAGPSSGTGWIAGISLFHAWTHF